MKLQWRIIPLLALLSVAHPGVWAAPVIANREPKANEIGYRPANGSVTRLNPPSFIWLHETEARTYAIQWSTRKDFQQEENSSQAEGLPFNTYTHSEPLKPGTYYWRYCFTDKNGARSNWSQSRAVTVPPDAAAMPMPTRAQQRERVPQDHPRLFMRPEDLPRLRELAKGREADRFNALRKEADKIMKSEPTPEPKERGTARDSAMRKFWWPNRVTALKACDEAETLAFVYLITGEKKYGDAARKWILHLASWDPDGPTNFSLNDEAAMPMLHRPARAYDWAYSALTAEDRAKVQAAMKRRAMDVWKSGQVGYGVKHLNSPFESHANRVWHKLGENAIAMLGDVPEAADWLDYAVNKFYAAYPVWCDDDGGWHEGVSYWAGYMVKVVWWLQVAQSALKIDGMKKPFFAQVGDFPLYIAPPGSPNEGFGDLSFNTPSRGWGGFTEYFQRAMAARPEGKEAGYWRWWSQQWKMGTEGGILGFLYAANLGALPEPKAPTDLPQSKIFHGIGVASLHTTLLNAADDVHFLMKSSPYGSMSHGHNAQNSFILNAYGEPLLTACVYRDWHGSPFHYKWAHSTVAQNAVLVNGQGQIMHTAAARGKIVEEKLTPDYDYVVGDATEAYGGRLTRALRRVAFLPGSAAVPGRKSAISTNPPLAGKDAGAPSAGAPSGAPGDTPSLIIICDDLATTAPATFQFMLHSGKAFDVDEPRSQLSIERPKASAVISYLSPTPLKYRQWDGYDPAPEKNFPNQWHVEAGTQEKKTDLQMLTVIAPYRAGQKLNLKIERLETPTAVGARISGLASNSGGAKETMIVAFRKSGATGEAVMGQTTFSGPVYIGK